MLSEVKYEVHITVDMNITIITSVYITS